MKKLLYVNAHPDVDGSTTVLLAETFLEKYKTKHEDVEIEELKLFDVDIPDYDADMLTATGRLPIGSTLSERQAKLLERRNELLDQFLAADIVVLANPLWNFSVPARMKAYLDLLCVAGQTFRYTAEGSEGLVGDKKVLHIQSQGGVHSNDGLDLASNYVKVLMQFFGISDYQDFILEGKDAFPDKREEIIEQRVQDIKQLATTF